MLTRPSSGIMPSVTNNYRNKRSQTVNASACAQKVRVQCTESRQLLIQGSVHIRHQERLMRLFRSKGELSLPWRLYITAPLGSTRNAANKTFWLQVPPRLRFLEALCVGIRALTSTIADTNQPIKGNQGVAS
jgi:hypothetical protein